MSFLCPRLCRAKDSYPGRAGSCSSRASTVRMARAGDLSGDNEVMQCTDGDQHQQTGAAAQRDAR